MRRFFIGACAGFLGAYAVVRTIEALADLRSPRGRLPADAARYGATRRALMLAGIVRGLAANAVMAFAVADRLPERLRKNETPAGAALYYAGGTLLETILETPIDYLERFAIERRYGLSDQSLRGWLEDRGKAIGVSLALTTPIVTGLMAAARRFPRRWPLIASAGVPPLLILSNLFIPVYVSPLFNAFEPLRGPLEERLRALATRYGVGDAQILRFDMSRQTKKANAYVTGLFGTHRIVVADTLLDGFNPEEVEFVVAHELGHYVARDTWIGVIAGSVAGTTLIVGAHALARRDEDPVTTTPGLQRFSFYLALLATVIGPLLAWGSREIERRADRFAVRATESPSAGIAAFERLRERNLAEDEQPRWAEVFFSTHPSLKSRIAALRSV